MVKLNKSPLPPDIKIENERDYRSRKVYDLLISDCHNKCYLCEDGSMPLDVEHIVAHGGDEKLKYNWDNMLAACEHCNKAKNRKEYSHILNCIKVDPEEHISISIRRRPDLKEYVEIKELHDSKVVSITKNLLELIYNGENTPRRHIYSPKLRKKALDERNKLTKVLADYEDELNPQRKEDYRQSIIEMIDRKTPFAAIKRNVIKNKLAYKREFGMYLS